MIIINLIKIVLII